MSAEDRPSAMRRKAGAARPQPEIGRFTAAKALRLAVAQAGEEVAALVVTVGQLAESRTNVERFTESLPEYGLIALVEGPESRFGLVVLDPQAMAALIEIQTTGRVVPRPAAPRPPTRTDAILCADFIDRVLELLETRVSAAGLELAPALTGFRYAMPLADPRAVSMTLEDMPYRRFELPLDLAHGAKTGTLNLLLPFDPPAPGHAHGPAADAAAFSDALEALVMDRPAELGATLARHEMALADALALAPGALIPVPRAALARVAVEDLGGKVVAHGRLGQIGGHRAVRLVPEPEAAESAEAALAGAVAGLVPGPVDLGDLGGDFSDGPGEAADGGAGGFGDLGDLSGLAGLGGGEAGGGPADPGDMSNLGDPGAVGGTGPEGGGLGPLDGSVAPGRDLPALSDPANPPAQPLPDLAALGDGGGGALAEPGGLPDEPDPAALANLGAGPG